MSYQKMYFAVLIAIMSILFESGLVFSQPNIQINPIQFVVDINEDQTSIRKLTIQNEGNSNLVYSISNEFISGLVLAKATDQNYHWRDSNQPGGPNFQWIDITTSGTKLNVSGDDNYGGPYNIGFPFTFYDVEYTQFFVCTNGFVSFTSTSNANSNTNIPSSDEPNTLLAAFWDDLISYSIYHHYDGTKAVIEFYNSYHYGSSSPYTFEIILYPSGKIVYQYLTMDGVLTSASIGIENQNGSEGVQVACDESYIENNLAVEFFSGVIWLTIDPASGSVPQSGSTDIQLTFDATDIPGGSYGANLIIESNDPVDSTLTVPITLNVTGQPDIAVNTDILDFGLTYINYPDTMDLKVWNEGSSLLNISNISSNNPDFSPAINSVSIAPGDTQNVTVQFSPSLTGNISGKLTLSSNDLDEAMLQIDLLGLGAIAPDIAVNPAEISMELNEGVQQNTSLTVTNQGIGTLHYSILLKSQLGNHSRYSVQDVLKANEIFAAKASLISREHDICSNAQTESASKYEQMSWKDILKSRTGNIQLSDDPIRAVVIRGIGTRESTVTQVWDYLNSYWMDFGTLEILVDYSSLNKSDISYSDLVDSDADVLIISDNWSDYYALTEAECIAIAQYINEGHGLYMSAGTFNNYSYYVTEHQIKYFGPLIGIDPDRTYYWDSYSLANPVDFLDINHSIWEGLSSPYECSYYGANTYPTPGYGWRDAIIDGEILAISTDNKTAIIGKDNRIYHSTLPECNYYGINDDDYQFLYNVIVFTASEGINWCSVTPQDGSVNGNSSSQVTVTFDASVVDQGTYTGFMIIESNDPDEPEVDVRLSMTVTDITPPGAVTDLSVESIASTFAILSWTAPGDNELQGTAESYELRFLNQPITVSNWSSAISVADTLPDPESPGRRQSIRITHLTPNTTYYFALKTKDEANHYSSLSNVLQVKTPEEVEALIYLPFEEISGEEALNYQGNEYFNGQLLNFENLDGQDVATNSGWTQFGYAGGALKFDGSNDYVLIPDFSGSPLHINTALTLKMALKCRNDILPTGNYNFYEIINKIDSYTGYALRFNLENGRLRFLIQYGSSNVGIYESNKSTWAGGQWYEIMVTYDYYSPNDNVKIYIDNQLDVIYKETRLLTINDASITLGGGYTSYWEFPGTIDEVLIHNKTLVIDVDESPSVNIPDKFKISQNFPNPFNPMTTINYSLSKKEYVVIKIFNINGQEVKTLLDREQTPGEYSVTWNGLNNQGKFLPSGLYYYQITAGEFKKTLKMTLLK